MRPGWSASGLTLVELIITLAIVTIVFGAILPQVRAINNSWDSKAGASETLQNGRILTDHLNRRLSRAARILAVSDSTETNGFIEFEDNDGNSFRYDIDGTTGYVEFGPLGSLADLAGPVSELQFTCYNATDLDTPITNVDAVRSVRVRAVLVNAAGLDKDMTFTSQVYIRTNSLPAAGGDISKMSDPWLEFDTLTGMEPALVHMSGTKFLCAYRGDSDDGYARILTVNPADWSVGSAGFIEYDTRQGITPALAKIDDTHFLCAYQGDRGDGWSLVLYEAMPGMLVAGPPLEFDAKDCVHPALSQIDSSHFLCAYRGTSNVQATVLTVDTGTWSTTYGSPFPFDIGGASPALSKIDDTHYLCAYTGEYGDGWSIVLTVDTVDWTVCGATLFGFDPYACVSPALSKIDDTHYLCAYEGADGDGYAVVLNVNTADWTISQGTNFEYDTVQGGAPDLSKIDNTSFLCAYRGPGDTGVAVVLTVDTGNWTISKSAPFTFEIDIFTEPALCQIDVGHYLCAHSGSLDDGYAGVLELGSPILP